MSENITVNDVTYPEVDAVSMVNENGDEVLYYADAVRYNEQELTDVQKEQARTNIGAADQEKVSQLSEEIADLETLSLGVNADDGLIYLYKNNQPMGNGIPMASGGDVVGYLDSDNNIILSGALTEGTYIVKYEMEDGTLVDIGTLTNADEPEIVIVNQIPISQNADGTLFVGTNGEAGYKTGYRISGSSGNESAQTGTEVTGFIPFNYNDTVYMKDITDDGTHVIGWYDSSFNKVATLNIANTFGGAINGEVVSKQINAALYTAITESAGIAYMRVSASEITADSIITVNQPIE